MNQSTREIYNEARRAMRVLCPNAYRREETEALSLIHGGLIHQYGREMVRAVWGSNNQTPYYEWSDFHRGHRFRMRRITQSGRGVIR